MGPNDRMGMRIMHGCWQRPVWETHYAKHHYFIRDNEILERIGSLPKVPVSIVHGRRDLTCLMESAWLLHRAVPGSRLVAVSEAGHLMTEPEMASALVQETERLKGLLA